MDKLLLISGNDIPFIEGKAVIHQPKLKEIAFLGETTFYNGCNFLNFSKNAFLNVEDNSDLEVMTNFDILMSILKEKNSPELRKISINALQVLALIFPTSQISFGENVIILTDEQNDQQGLINNDNFEVFKSIIKEMFCLNIDKDSPEYNPDGSLANAIAKKLEERKRKLAEMHGGGDSEISILNRYASILSIGLQIDINTIMSYSVYQLFDAFQRFNLWQAFDMNLKARLAGAKDVKEPENWMKDLYNEKNN